MKQQRRLALLEQKVPRPDPDQLLEQKRWQKISDRFFVKIEKAMKLMTPDEERQVEKAVVDLSDSGEFSVYIGPWLMDLLAGRSRFPKLSDAVMKVYALFWLFLTCE